MKKCGINRISIGLQSTHDDILRCIGRKHSFNDFINALDYINSTNICNISVDLMYPLPNLDITRFKDTINTVLKLKDKYPIKHISVYNLEIHPNTKLEFLLDNNFLKLVDEDEEYEMKNLLDDLLVSNGFKQYEISNYCIDGYASKHNLMYWEQKYYLGFGASAASFLLGTRYKNTDDIVKYINGVIGGDNIITQKDDMDLLGLMKEYVILNLRLCKGVIFDKFYSKFGKDLFDIFGLQIQDLLENGLLIKNNESVFLSKRGREVANIVWEKFI